MPEADEKNVAETAVAQKLSSIFLVMTEPNDGQEDEFNDWYTNIHCHDIMRLQGSVAVQRFKLSPYQLRYNRKYVGPRQPWLCIYELNNSQQNLDDHVRYCFSDAMPISSALNVDTGEDFYYVPVVPGKTAVECFNARGGHVLLISMNIKDEQEAQFIKWYREHYQPRLLKLIGFGDGDLYRAAEIQLINRAPTYEFSAVYHVDDPMVAVESLDSHLAQSKTILDCPHVEPGSIGIACYSPISNRLTAEQARNLPLAQKQLEDRFRENMKGRRLTPDSVDTFKVKPE